MSGMKEKYRILNTLATGGTAVLYKAVQISLDRPVAVKQLHAHLMSDPDFARRFRFEAKAAAHLDHENIVRIIDFGTTGDDSYIVMEYIEGPSLKEVLASRRGLGGELAMLVAHQICLGLDHAHRRGVVHRDIKPANILVGVDGRVKITDFGLAKLHRPDDQQTIASTLLGTPLYMSPEQAVGEALDGRSDLFSLGTVCYEAITGVQPFRGESYAAVIQNILHGAVAEPSRLRGDIGPEIEAIVMKALSRDPAKRFPDARAMACAIESALGRETVLGGCDRLARLACGGDDAKRPPKERVRRRTRRRALPLAVAGTCAALLVLFSFQSGLIRLLPRSIGVGEADPAAARPEPVLAAHGEPIPGLVMTKLDESPPPSDPQAADTAASEPAAEIEQRAAPAETASVQVAPPPETTHEAAPAETPDRQPPNPPGPAPAPEAPAGGTDAHAEATGEKTERARPVAPRVETGFLDIAVEPPASISIDGEPQTASGRLSMLELPAGTHEVVCRRDGYREYVETIRIVKGELSRRRIALREIMGALSIASEGGAELYIDGVFRAALPLSAPVPLSPGAHRVELRKPGRHAWSTSVFVPAEETVRLTISLVPLSAGQ